MGRIYLRQGNPEKALNEFYNAEKIIQMKEEWKHLFNEFLKISIQIAESEMLRKSLMVVKISLELENISLLNGNEIEENSNFDPENHENENENVNNSISSSVSSLYSINNPGVNSFTHFSPFSINRTPSPGSEYFNEQNSINSLIKKNNNSIMNNNNYNNNNNQNNNNNNSDFISPIPIHSTISSSQLLYLDIQQKTDMLNHLFSFVHSPREKEKFFNENSSSSKLSTNEMDSFIIYYSFEVNSNGILQLHCSWNESTNSNQFLNSTDFTKNFHSTDESNSFTGETQGETNGTETNSEMSDREVEISSKISLFQEKIETSQDFNTTGESGEMTEETK